MAEVPLRAGIVAPSFGRADRALGNDATAPRRSELARERIWHGAAYLLAALSSVRPTGCVLCNDAAAARRSELAREWSGHGAACHAVTSRRGGLERDAFGFLFGCWGVALSSPGTTGCALHGASLFFVCGSPPGAKKSKQKKAHPFIRVRSLRALTPLAPVPLQGPAAKGHPCLRRPRPITAFAASMPLNPLHGTYVRPPARGVRCRLLARVCETRKAVLSEVTGDSDRFPVRRPSVGVAQGDARHGRRARNNGTGTSHCDGPRSSAGAREVRARSGLTRMSGWPSFWLLVLGPGGDPQTRKSDAPCKAQPVAGAEESAALQHPSRCQPNSRSRPRPRVTPYPPCSRASSLLQGPAVSFHIAHFVLPAEAIASTPKPPLPMKSPSECA